MAAHNDEDEIWEAEYLPDPQAEDDESEDGLFERHRIVADRKQGLIRLDKFLMDRLPHTSRTKVQEAIDQAFITVNGQPVKASYKVKPLDDIRVSLPTPPHSTDILGEDIPLNIVYEDESLLLVDKPPGLVVHPAHGNWTGTLVNALVWHFENLPTSRNGEIRPGLVHRIDKDTSGLLVIAKTETAMTRLARQFFVHSIEREYYALVWGQPEPAEGTINVHLGRSPKDRRLTVAIPDGSQGRHAITHYRTLKTWGYVSLVACRLETGRTHQIRAHMRYLGHPIFSDEMYGGRQILKGQLTAKYRAFVENCFALMPRQALHARVLGFTHPETGQEVHFECPLPADFQQVLDRWDTYIAARDAASGSV